MRIAIIGFGSVGRGIAEVIAAKTTGIIVTAVADSRSGSINAAGLDVTAVLRDKQETGMCGTPGVTASDIISSDVYDVLVEVSPPTNAETGEPALGISDRHLHAANMLLPQIRALLL